MSIPWKRNFCEISGEGCIILNLKTINNLHITIAYKSKDENGMK